MKIGFIGLGRMGTPMVLNLIKKGHDLSVYDIDKKACKEGIKAGASLRSNPAELASQVNFVISSLPGPREVADVMTGANGVLEGIPGGSLVIETSTIGSRQSRDLAQRFMEKKVSYIDATVNRIDVNDVVKGKMTIMVGGTKEAFKRAKPILKCLGDNIFHMGPNGLGNAVKVLNQMIYLSYMAAFSEGLALGESLGIPLKNLLEVFSTSAAGHKMIMDRFNQMDEFIDSPGFTIDRIIKDLELANELCDEKDYEAPIFSSTLEVYKKASQKGLGSCDVTVLNR